MYVFNKPEAIMLSVLPIIPYPKFILIILNLFPRHHLLYQYNFSVLAHGYIVADEFV